VAKWLAKGWIPPSAAAFVNIVQADVHPPGPDSHAGNSPHSTLPSLTFLRPPAVGTSRRDGLANPLQSAFAVPLPPGQVDCGMCLDVTSRKVLELYSLWQPPPKCGGGRDEYVKGPATELAKIASAVRDKAQKLNDAVEARQPPISDQAPHAAAKLIGA
jgi:hypothetical protein